MKKTKVKSPTSSLTIEENGELGNALWTIREASHYLRVSETTLYRQVRFGLIPSIRIGGQIRFLKCKLDLWVKGELYE